MIEERIHLPFYYGMEYPFYIYDSMEDRSYKKALSSSTSIVIKVIRIAANIFLMGHMIPSLLNKTDEQGEGNHTAHEQYPKAADDC